MRSASDLIRELRTLENTAAFSYLAGVIAGDGYITKNWSSGDTVGLGVNDLDFAETFAAALRLCFGIPARVRPERSSTVKFRVRITRVACRFEDLLRFTPSSDEEARAWIRGFFDSEGNALLVPSKASANAFSRRVSVYNTDLELVDLAESLLAQLGFRTVRYQMKPSRGHFGTKPVWELRLRASREQFSRFAIEIGSSIARKQATLEALPESYQPPGHHSRAGKAGYEARWGGRTACNHGHPWSADNTGSRRHGKRMTRFCRACKRNDDQKYQARRKASAP